MRSQISEQSPQTPTLQIPCSENFNSIKFSILWAVKACNVKSTWPWPQSATGAKNNLWHSTTNAKNQETRGKMLNV